MASTAQAVEKLTTEGFPESDCAIMLPVKAWAIVNTNVFSSRGGGSRRYQDEEGKEELRQN